MIVRESPDELTLRAAEVNTSKALINVNHIEPGRWGPHLVDAEWNAFCQALYKGIEREDWEEMYDSYKEMSRALWCDEAAGGPEGKSLVGHESSQRQEGRVSRSGSRRGHFEKDISRIQLLRWTKH